jgi:omega-6 fatty acid desaturase (delta-12 desaturase)
VARVNPSRPTDWSRRLAPYRRPSATRSIRELAITAGALLGIWALAWGVFHVGLWWLSLLLAIPAGGFLVRLFMIQHDCGHGSFFEDRAANDWVGRVLGLFTLTPYDYWRRTHAMHHATSGNLDRRGLGAIDTLTVEEYLALPKLRRLGYRLYRHPAVLFGLGPVFNFLLAQRLPLGMMRDRAAWISVLGNSLFTFAGVAALAWLVGSAPVLSVNLLTMVIAGTIGIWLFFVQHQFEGVAWSRNGEWRREDAALHGSSHLDLPQPLRWMTANIGVHHVHHLSSRIPFYRLPEVLRDFPHLKPLSRMTIRDTFGCARLALWHEAERRMVSFKDLKTLRSSRALAA